MKIRSTPLIALGAVSLLALAGCSSSAEAEVETASNGDQQDMSLAVFNGWDEGIAVSELWKAILDEKGYNVELEYADVAAVYEGLSSSDYDLTMDIWLPDTHGEYLETYGDEITDLGAWNNESKLTIAVNEDAPIDSLAELAENADLFNNQIVGIEAGAGLTAATEDRVIPSYGLEGMEFTTSSTAAMLTELKAATDAGENVVVTLWEPHWAYGSFPIKNLEDPEGTLESVESLHSFGSADFSENFPEASGWIEGFEMDLELLYTLEEAMFVDYDGSDYAPIVAQWIEDNQEYVDGLTS
ncbi:glycine betaine ABC transporter substrate-binding protein [Cryobacterium melibiosiphilum]|uniref:Glycine betaine ABC transporter substrate-binding protein n=1 Tax=Cryobacterium melibiosiphilum TaxID=995039 RepID=A0A3A5MJM3_9MICO|nr:glycine betaine ABC transporter substrate-binding protein [Cryobacterium melibiosiphilum]RJT84804.1 glycine betaine ABC transporter substrate-binding protein [Cryobacterium melibiosiphilum]